VLKLKEENEGLEREPREGMLGSRLTAVSFSLIYELDDPGFNFLRNVQTTSETCPAPSSTDTGVIS